MWKTEIRHTMSYDPTIVEVIPRGVVHRMFLLLAYSNRRQTQSNFKPEILEFKYMKQNTQL